MIKANILTKIRDDYINKLDNVASLLDHEILVKVKCDDCTQEAILRCMHVLSITSFRTNNYFETDLHANI